MMPPPISKAPSTAVTATTIEVLVRVFGAP
jgi:hypothetical protein